MDGILGTDGLFGSLDTYGQRLVSMCPRLRPREPSDCQVGEQPAGSFDFLLISEPGVDETAKALVQSTGWMPGELVFAGPQTGREERQLLLSVDPAEAVPSQMAPLSTPVYAALLSIPRVDSSLRH
jgi:hypothetical protein